MIGLWRSGEPLQGAIHHQGQEMAGQKWAVYKCTTCGKAILSAGYPIVILTSSTGVKTMQEFKRGEALEVHPAPSAVDLSIPDRARRYLEQAIEALNSPDGAVMLCASSVVPRNE
jgi:hypothetical protein